MNEKIKLSKIRQKDLKISVYLLNEIAKKSNHGVKIDLYKYAKYISELDSNTRKLHSKLKNGNYKPGKCKKIYAPKTSSAFRVFTVLNTEDHIVYQTIALLIRDKCISWYNNNYNELWFGSKTAKE